MAKKFFCDGCGDEMNYSSIRPHLKGNEVTTDLKAHGGRHLKFEVSIKFLCTNPKDGEHVDLCEDCRIHLLRKITPQLGEKNGRIDT